MRWLATLVVCFGCYAPRPQAGSPCANAPCPAGLVCSITTSTCELESRPAADARVDDALESDDASITADAPRPDAGPTVPMLRQQTTAYADMADMASATLPSLPTSGDVLVMIGGNPANGLASVTGGGATWTRAARSTVNLNIEVWFGVTDGSSAVVTIALPNSNAPTRLWVGEWSGLDAMMTLDRGIAAAGFSSPATITAPPTTNPHDLVIFGVADESPNTFGIPTPGSWTPVTPIVSATTYQSAWYRIETAIVTPTAQVTETSHFWDAALVAFRIAP